MNRKKLILCSGIANTFEWYDYALFGNFAGLIGAKFFPNSDPKVALLNAFAVFAVGYLMRPLGGIFFGVIGDKFGRKFSLSISIICMSLPTAVIGLLPTYDDIGVTASVLMVLMRMIQGLSMGGALTGSISFLIEHTEKKNRGLVGSVPMASICLGILLGTLVSYFSREMLTHDQFDSWGWRLPFIIGILILFVGVYIKNYMEETPLFEDMKAKGTLTKSPLKVVFRDHWFDMLVSIMINSTGSVLFYFQAIYVANFLKFTRDFSDSMVDKLSAISYLIMAFACIFAGKLSDIIGRRRVFVLLIVVICLSIQFITKTLQFGDWNFVFMSQIFLGLLAAFFIGPEPALQAEFYPTQVRSTALSISYNLATSLFGGTTPYIITYLYNETSSLNGCGYYIIITSFFTLVGLYFYKNRCKDLEYLR
jgi:MHS family proline/betaine transporter-like MFS transporter